jgi:hypothetical protein
VIRHGQTGRARTSAARPAERFRELIASAPAPDDEFAGDLRAHRAGVPASDDASPS